MGQKDETVLRELGAKLANFRRKLALAIGQKKITQAEFGEMYGGQTPRMMTSFENGDVDAPASLFYLIWQSGNSVDAIFEEGPITDKGRMGAAKLYEACALAALKNLDKDAVSRLQAALKESNEVTHAKNRNNGTTKETTSSTSGKGKANHSKASPTKKH